jgi:hypothetical protein
MIQEFVLGRISFEELLAQIEQALLTEVFEKVAEGLREQR